MDELLTQVYSSPRMQKLKEQSKTLLRLRLQDATDHRCICAQCLAESYTLLSMNDIDAILTEVCGIRAISSNQGG